jgi:YegS/Rv2252/BmrU family lipid kinase
VERILLVANAAAGTHEQEALDAALEVLRPSADVEVVATTHPEELDELCENGGDRSIVVAGGDGSLHAIVNALFRLDLLAATQIGLIPLGTGNDFARGVGIPLDPADAARVIASGHTRAIDVVVDDTGLVVVNNAHLGVGTQASREASKWKSRLGRFGYVVGALEAALRPEFIRVRVAVDGESVAPGLRVAQVAIGNGSNVGGGTELIPGAHPGSGRLVVIVSRAAGTIGRLVYLARLRRGSHHELKEVTRVAGTEVSVEGDEFWLTSDGEVSGPHTSRRWELRSGAATMYLPASVPPPGA